MRVVKISLIVIFLLYLIIPYTVLIIFGDKPTAPLQDNNEYPEVLLYRTETKQVERINSYDYLCACVCGEMSPESEPEALKAQSVAAFTYLLGRMNYVKENPEADIGHSGAYVCDDSAHCMAYLEKETAKSKWGKSYFEKNYNKIENAVSETIGKYVSYDGEPINAVFHSISSGSTQSAKEVWGSEVAYLVSVNSDFDKSAEGYETKAVFSKSEFAKVFSEQLGVTLPEDEECWIGEMVKSESGIVKQLTVADTVYTGLLMRKLFGLRSACFDLKLEKNDIVFTVYGYGHGVGMSQSGANVLAKKGYNYKEILKYYYSNTEISQQND